MTDAQWAAIAPHCLGRERDPGRIGCPWRDLPSEFGTWNTVFKRFRRWVKADAFYFMFKALADDASIEYVMVDGPIVKVRRQVAGGPGV